MTFFTTAITTLKTLVIALGAGLAVWGVINLMEGYGGDNPAAKSQGMKQLMAGGGIVLIGMNLIPLLSGLFSQPMGIIDKITDAIKEMLISCIESNLTDMFADVNEKVQTIAEQVGKTPQGWNSSVFDMIKSLSENVVIPIAGMIITFVLCYELITMVMEKNNMHDFETFLFFKYIFKMWVAVYLLTHVFDITLAVFDVAQHVVNKSAALISGSTNIEVTTTIVDMLERIKELGMGELVGLTLETMLIGLCMKILSVLITVILYGRMIEIYLYTSVAPIPFATMTNREWGSIGTNYVRGLLALGFQGFFIMVCVGIYSVLVNNMTIAANIHTALFSIAAYTIILCFSLFKTGTLAKSIFNAH